MTTHHIPMATASENAKTHDILTKSTFVYRTSKSSFPTRIVEWSNINRLNNRNGEGVRYGDYGKLDGGNGLYLDPHNDATDSMVTVLISTESTSIDAYGTGTGTPASGQQWATQESLISEGDILVLLYPDGTEWEYVAHFTNNGHGVAVPNV